MLKPEQVPDEVWKALRREVEGSGLRHWNEIVAAVLNAWTGMQHDNYVIILPLTPQEITLTEPEASDEH